MECNIRYYSHGCSLAGSHLATPVGLEHAARRDVAHAAPRRGRAPHTRRRRRAVRRGPPRAARLPCAVDRRGWWRGVGAAGRASFRPGGGGHSRAPAQGARIRVRIARRTGAPRAVPCPLARGPRQAPSRARARRARAPAAQRGDPRSLQRAWKASGRARDRRGAEPLSRQNEATMNRYVTRERVHIDRIATAWAIRRFVDPSATFAFVERERDPASIDGTPFDMRGGELSHRDGKVTFEVLLDKHELASGALARMAAIIHAVDTQEDGAAEAKGVRAVFDGIRDGLDTDEARLDVGFRVCDALYAYCGGR